ncbi:MAG: YitT family protein [Chloroflexota bacterium]
MRRSVWPILRDVLLLTAGAVGMAINANLFLVPADLAPGGVFGTSLILNELTGWPIGLMMLVLNVPLMALGYRRLGRLRFLTRTLYVVLLYNLGVDVVGRWLPPAGITDEILLNALYGGVLGGIAMGLVFRGGGTSAGTGILGRVLQLKTGIPVSQIYVVTDGAVIIGAGLVFGWEKALYAMITVFVWGLASDYILEGPSVVRTAFIVTDHAPQVAAQVLTRLGLGVTAWNAQGMFTEEAHTVLFCTVSRPDVDALRAVVYEADPAAFLVIAHGHQARGGVLRQGGLEGSK